MPSSADVRHYGLLPSEVNEAFIQSHLDAASRDVRRDSGITMLDSNEPDHEEAVTLACLIRLLPRLHTFTLPGASKAMRLSSDIEARFLSPDEVEAEVSRLSSLYRKLIQVITQSPKSQPQGTSAAGMLAAI